MKHLTARSVALDRDGFAQMAPYLAGIAVCAAFALAPNLYPARVLPIEVPVTGLESDGAASTESIAPEVAPPSPVAAVDAQRAFALSRDSVPDALSSPPAAPDAVLAQGGGSGAISMPTHAATAPHAGARAVQPPASHAVKSGAIALRNRSPVAPHAPRNAAVQSGVAQSGVAQSGAVQYGAALSGVVSGNRPPRIGVLGGAGPFAARIAAKIGGTGSQQRH